MSKMRSPNYVAPEEQRKVRKKELQQKVGKPKYLMDSFVQVRCPECGLKLTPAGPASEKAWITQCKWYHCWKVSEVSGRTTLTRVEKTDDEYPRRRVYGK